MSDIKKIDQTIGIIGGGNLSKAICEGMVLKGLAEYSQMWISGPHVENLECWKNKGAKTTTNNGLVLDESEIIFLAIKPHILKEATTQMLKSCTPSKTSNKLFISVLAGIKLLELEKTLADLEGARVIRVMPNTPLVVGEGCVVYCPGKFASRSDTELVKKIFETSGMCELVPESIINQVGALQGSGPAYICLVIEALADGAVKMGVPREMAIKFAAQTVFGTAKMILETGKHPALLKDEVCSPGGSTIAGMHALEKGGVRGAFIDAIEAATKRWES